MTIVNIASSSYFRSMGDLGVHDKDGLQNSQRHFTNLVRESVVTLL
jgi:hypothetical protein